MTLNEYMHPRNRYRNNPSNFEYLANKYEDLKPYVKKKSKGGVTLDFRNSHALRALTYAVLKEDFNLNIQLSLERLIPRIPQKLNYLHWIEDLIGMKEQAVGIDIGGGCSCIHALLAVRMNPLWEMIVSEIDPLNVKMATENVERNHLQNQIKVIRVDPTMLLHGLLDKTKQYDFLMCNPPFFTDIIEAQGLSNTRTSTRHQANSVSTASDIEMIFNQGGEVSFVKRIINESYSYKNNVRLFTTQLGKKSSLTEIVKDLKLMNNDLHYITSEFCQGHTMRWAIAWTFDQTYIFPTECHSHLASKTIKKAKKKEAEKVPLNWTFDEKYSMDYIKKYLEYIFNELKLSFQNISEYAWTFDAYENTWSHQRRKRRHQQDDEQTTTTKRLKLDDEQSMVNIEQTSSTINKIKICSVQVRLQMYNKKCTLYMSFVDGINSDAANQVLQYMKNHFVSYETKIIQ